MEQLSESYHLPRGDFRPIFAYCGAILALPGRVFCFHERKWVHTRLSEKDRTQGHTRRNSGRFERGGITILDTYCTFTNIPGPGIRTAYFAAFGSWLDVLSKNAESLRDSDALMHVAVPRRRGPAGLRDFFTFVEVAACTPCAQGLSACARRGVVSPLLVCSACC